MKSSISRSVAWLSATRKGSKSSINCNASQTSRHVDPGPPLSARHQRLIPEVFLVKMCAVFFKEGQILFLKGSCPVMFDLLLDVMDRFLNLRDTNAECTIALLPSKVSKVWIALMNPSR
jgi:hypothetical protein